MLVLSRKQGESIAIGNDIRVKINWIRGKLVSVGIEAPKAVKVVREEIKERAA